MPTSNRPFSTSRLTSSWTTGPTFSPKPSSPPSNSLSPGRKTNAFSHNRPAKTSSRLSPFQRPNHFQTPPINFLLTSPMTRRIFSWILLHLPCARRLQLLLHYLMSFYHDIPGYLVPDSQAVTAIFTSLLPNVHSSTRVLQRINPTPSSPPPGLVFGPLTLADTPLTLVDDAPSFPSARPQGLQPSTLRSLPVLPFTHRGPDLPAHFGPAPPPSSPNLGPDHARGLHASLSFFTGDCGTTPFGWIPSLPFSTPRPMPDKRSFGCAHHSHGNLREAVSTSESPETPHALSPPFSSFTAPL